MNGYIRIGVFNFQQRDVENLNDSAIRVPSDTIYNMHPNGQKLHNEFVDSRTFSLCT